jgi:hypothetical protein
MQLSWVQELTQQVGAAAMDTTPASHSSSGTQRSHLGLSSPLGQVQVLKVAPAMISWSMQQIRHLCTAFQQHGLDICHRQPKHDFHTHLLS